jgi:ElaB/YqjD/DUF883 family membrane-anchored ribosome-binding protein
LCAHRTGHRKPTADHFTQETAMTETNEGTIGDFAADLAALRRDVARLGETMSTLVQRQSQAAGHRVVEAVGDAREKLAGTAAGAQTRICAASSAIEARIERNPLTAVLIAAGVGVSLGLLSTLAGRRA